MLHTLPRDLRSQWVNDVGTGALLCVGVQVQQRSSHMKMHAHTNRQRRYSPWRGACFVRVFCALNVQFHAVAILVCMYM